MSSMRPITALFICLLHQSLNAGLPARSDPSDYAGWTSGKGVIVAADVVAKDQVRNSFALDLSEYAVIEVALYPQKLRGAVNVSTMDFALRLDGRTIHPADPANIAELHTQKPQSTHAVAVWPHAGVIVGTHGPQPHVGVEAAPVRRRSGPPSPRDRRAAREELRGKAITEGSTRSAVAGYLYFPVGRTKLKSAELVYAGDASLRLVTR